MPGQTWVAPAIRDAAVVELLQTIDLNGRLIEDLHKMLRRVIGEGVDLVTAPASRPYSVKTNAVDLRRECHGTHTHRR